MVPVITQVFPDEFHLNTLDQLLSATARLNPHVNVKSIVIGLMDRLSSYASRESESEAPEDRQQYEQEAVAQLLENLRILKETKEKDAEKQHTTAKQSNGEQVNDDAPRGPSKEQDEEQPKPGEHAPPAVSNGDNASPKKHRGIPDNINLYEIFYGQVTNLVNAQRLQIQDTIALLVSLTNLAL